MGETKNAITVPLLGKQVLGRPTRQQGDITINSFCASLYDGHNLGLHCAKMYDFC
jgi:hypothetical protein